VRYISLFSGIEAASVAFLPLGWTPQVFAEIEEFPSAVLRERFPGVPNVGDVTKHDWAQYSGQCEVMVGGFPCQSMSVAGLRGSLSDPRGQLSLEYARIVHAVDPVWSIAENVPGWLSTGDNAFGHFLGRLVGEDAPLVPVGGRWTNAGMASGPIRTAAWRVLDAQYFGLAQRRRRVFVLSVRGARNWACGAALFPHWKGVPWDPATGREERARATAGLAGSASSRGGPRVGADEAAGGHLIDEVSFALNAKSTGRFDATVETLVPAVFDEMQITHPENRATVGGDRPAGTISRTSRLSVFWTGDGEVADPLSTTEGKTYTHEGNSMRLRNVVAHESAGGRPGIRRLTPLETERLQGFSDGHTAIEFKGKPAKDAVRYRAVGNSMAVPVVRWLGQRILAVQGLAPPDPRR
jgi:DNA (cytosine-5)-methyltransferase 1